MSVLAGFFFLVNVIGGAATGAFVSVVRGGYLAEYSDALEFVRGGFYFIAICLSVCFAV